MKALLQTFYSSIFWLWNLAFLMLVYVGILPYVAPALLQASLAGEIPLTFMVSLLGLVGVPTVCTLVGWFRLRRQPELLMRLFYGVEAPLFVLCLVRLFLIRELTPATGQLFVTAGLCVALFTAELLVGYGSRRPALAWLQMIGHSLMLIAGVYVGTLLAFYAIPVFCIFLYHFLRFDWVLNLWWMLMSGSALFGGALLLLLVGFSCTLFVAMPFVLTHLYLRSWWRIASAFGRQRGWTRARAVTAGVAIAWCLSFMSLQQQPQVRAFALLEQPAQTLSDRQSQLAQSDTIRAGLLNAYLSSYRYLSPWEESNQLREMYRSIFGLSFDQAQWWQDFHNHWLSPFLYSGSRSDGDKAAQLYAQFFDTPIQKAERQPIQHALQSTVNRDQVQAGLLNINQQVVWLAQQQVTVTEQGDWAEVELYEQYQNATSDDQEIFYSFTLPESAAITGIWLGDTADPSQRFEFDVAPRGAAQQVYKDEVDRSNVVQADDPALLEQVGPRQYRLRVFPIPAQISPREPGELHLWLTYQTLPQDDGWPLPRLTEQRNIYWTGKTARQRNGRSIRRGHDIWLEANLPRQQQQVAPRSHRATLPGGYEVVANPLAMEAIAPLPPQRLAVVIDRSRSMAAHRQDLADSLRWLRQQENLDADLYFTTAAEGQPERLNDWRSFNLDHAVWYGSLQLPAMLQQFDQLRGCTAYDAVLVLTDAGNYELEADEAVLPVIADPVWLVHLGDSMPPAYSDAVLDLLQAGHGGVSSTLPEVLQRLAITAQVGGGLVTVADGYSWTMGPATSATTVTDGNHLAPMAARQLILALSRQRDLTQLAELDAVHAIAKSTEIVTPYSSMLVLVNERQRELLRVAEASGDRFQRQIEDGQEDLTEPGNPLNAVPIPESGGVMGLGLVAIALLLLRRRQVI